MYSSAKAALEKIFSDKILASKLSSLEEDEIFDFCLENSDEDFTREKFEEELMNMLYSSDAERKFLTEEELDLIAGGVGNGRIKKSVAALLTVFAIGGSGVLAKNILKDLIDSFPRHEGGVIVLNETFKSQKENFDKLKRVKVEDVEYVVLGEDLGENAVIDSDYFLKFGNDNLVNVKTADNVVGVNLGSPLTNLKSVNMPNVKEIGSGAFRFSDLESAVLPKVEKIGAGAFRSCGELTNVVIPNAKDIGDYAFSLCTSLEKIDLSKAEKIGANAFSGCDNLKEISVPRNVKITGELPKDCKITHLD